MPSQKVLGCPNFFRLFTLTFLGFPKYQVIRYLGITFLTNLILEPPKFAFNTSRVVRISSLEVPVSAFFGITVCLNGMKLISVYLYVM